MNREWELSSPEDDYENSPAKWQVKRLGHLLGHAATYPTGAPRSQPCSKEEQHLALGCSKEEQHLALGCSEEELPCFGVTLHPPISLCLPFNCLSQAAAITPCRNRHYIFTTSMALA